MAQTTKNGSVKLFDPELVSDLINKVKGHSSLAVLSASQPVGFAGNTEFVFDFASDVSVVGENGAKVEGGTTVAPVTIIPVKFEYGARVSDEFMKSAEEKQVEYVKAFNEGFAKKLAAGFDKAAMHGINPKTGSASTVIGTNHFDSKVTNTVAYDSTTPDECIESAIAMVEDADITCTGIAISATCRKDLAAMKNASGSKLYPEFAFGAKPETLGAQRLDVNPTVSTGSVDNAIVGDFENMFKWGFGEDISFKIIEYGDPDNTGADLAGHNQVYLRAEAYIGWAIADPAAFARVLA